MRRSKEKTFDQAAAMQAKAVRFLRDVVGDDDKADEIEALSVEEYAARKGLTLQNPATPIQKGRNNKMPQATKTTADDVLDSVWDEVIAATDDGETDPEDALEAIADLLNEFDAGRFPITDDDGEGEEAEATE